MPVTAEKWGHSGSRPQWFALLDGELVIGAMFRRKKDALAFGEAVASAFPSSWKEAADLAYSHGAYYISR